jgi:hypothetical protein
VHQDYILRMIQQLSGFVTGLMQLRRAGRTTEALHQIEDAYGRFTGLSGSLIHAISEEDLVQLLRARGGLDPDRTWALAELLREEALTYESMEQPEEATPRFLKSLRLYLEALDEIEHLPGQLEVTGLEEVIEHVEGLELAASTRLKLVDHFIETGRFDRAENVVLWSVDGEQTDRETLLDALAFYERLFRLTDRQLDEGGLSRDEVRHGLDLIARRLDDRAPIPLSE